MKYSASPAQIRRINSRVDQAVSLGDFSAFSRAQALLLIFDAGKSIQDAAMSVRKSHESVRLWVAAFLEKGVNSLKLKWPRGRQSKLSKSQCRELKEIVSNVPSNAGYDGGCWNAAMICNLIKKLFKVSYSVKYLPQLLHRIGLSYQKAKYLAAKANPKQRAEWMEKTWPMILAKAKRTKAMILFGDEASFALWGSLGYTWSPVGKQPLVPTNGNRRNLKVFGMIDFFSGKFINQIIDGKLNGASYIKFLRKVLRESSEKVIIIQDGASYHRSKEVKAFGKENQNRISLFRLPSYSPDYNPIECIWRKIKRAATHNVFFESFTELNEKVRNQLIKIKRQPAAILDLFGVYRSKKAVPTKG